MDEWKIVGFPLLTICAFAQFYGIFVPSVIFIYNACCIIGTVLLYFTAITIPILIRLWVTYQPEPTKPPLQQETSPEVISKTKEKLLEIKSISAKVKTTPLVSRNVDDVIDELIDLLLRDYVLSWYSRLVVHESTFCKQLKDHIRQILLTFLNKCHKIPDVELFTNDFIVIMTDHLKRIHCAIINPVEKIKPYKVYKFLGSKDEELDHLRHLTEFLLLTLLPHEYIKNKQLISLLREIFAVMVFYPVIDQLCDPDFINMKLISYFEHQHSEAERLRKKYSYAETYEDFIYLIQETVDLKLLVRLRYHLAIEITLATTSRNVKRSRGIEADKEFVPQNSSKGDLLQARNLPRYLNQLKYARSQCEKRLKMLGGTEYSSFGRSTSENLSQSSYLPGQKVLSMSVLMQSSICRRYLSKFLQKDSMHSLLGFWEGVEDMKQADKEDWHKLANEIVKIYIHNPSSCVRLSKNTLRGIEEFMMANKGPEAFFNGQEEVFKVIEDKYYASFLVSDVYHKMLNEVDKQGIDFTQELSDDNVLEDPLEEETDDKISPTSDVSVFDHSSYAQSQLKILVEKLSDKKQALEALKNNPKFENTVALKLESEVKKLMEEQSLLENHIEKTELWIEYLGIWQATIMEAMEKKENYKIVPYFVLQVQLASYAQSSSNKMAGWIVSKSLSAFHNLHQKLIPAASWLKKIELPTKPRFKTFDRNYLAKAKHTLQTFLYAVTKDDGLNKSEALYDFLSPSPDYMKHPPYPPKKSQKFNLLQFFKDVQNTLSPFEVPDEEELLFLDDGDSKEDKKDSIAEPLYSLIEEIFELKGLFSWMRKKLMLFVQVTYGQTINRHIRETVSWVLSEPMLLFYLQLFRDTMWPASQKSCKPLSRSEEECKETKIQAKQIILKNPPVVLCKFIGQEDTKKGMSKVFDSLQNKNLNKQLFYKLFEAFLYKYSPELAQISTSSSKEYLHINI